LICGSNKKSNCGLDFFGLIKALVIEMPAKALTIKVVVEPIGIKSKWQQNKQKQKKKLY
jgi:hypothetical protein